MTLSKPIASKLQPTLVFLFFFLLTAWKTYPLITHFTTGVPKGPIKPDPFLNAWILSWEDHALVTDPANFFNSNAFYPLKNTLAASELMLAVQPLYAPVYALTRNPVIAYNTVFFLTFPLCGLAMFLLAREWTQNSWAALVAGALYGFSLVRFTFFDHLQLLSFYWVPLAFLFLNRFLREKQWRVGFGFTITFALQALCSVYLGWILTVAVGIYFATYAMWVDRTLFSLARLRQCAVFLVLALLILIPPHSGRQLHVL